MYIVGLILLIFIHVIFAKNYYFLIKKIYYLNLDSNNKFSFNTTKNFLKHIELLKSLPFHCKLFKKYYDNKCTNEYEVEQFQRARYNFLMLYPTGLSVFIYIILFG